MAKITCKTGLKKNVINKEVFAREMTLCCKLYKKDKGCCWGKCKDCGVVPLLYKLHSGLLVENKNDVNDLKKYYFEKKSKNPKK